MSVEPDNMDVLGPWNQLLTACIGSGLDLDLCVLRTRVSLGAEPHEGLYIEAGVTKAFIYIDGVSPNYVFRCHDQSTFPYPSVQMRQPPPMLQKSTNPFVEYTPTEDDKRMQYLLQYIARSLEVRQLLRFPSDPEMLLTHPDPEPDL